jgi:NTE family protein
MKGAAQLAKVTINLALQGGGAHGAFTWGALDRLLREEEIEIEGVSATSAGAMNAAALKHGYVIGGREGARKTLSDFWLSLTGLDGVCSEAIMDWLRVVSPSPAITARALQFHPAAVAGGAITRVLSPYQFNPGNYHPLRETVAALLDDATMRSTKGPKLFVNATNVRSGKARIFQGKEVTTDAILASACLPTLYQAIEIEDRKTGRREAYWDGGFVGNPALYPLFYKTETPDILIIHINPLHREELPVTATEIESRINEISFNASLLRELRAIHFVNRMLDAGTLTEGAMKRNYVHSVSDDTLMNQLGLASKMTPNRALLLQLRDAGYASMDAFLSAHGAKLNQKSSLDLRAVVASEGSEV